MVGPSKAWTPLWLDILVAALAIAPLFYMAYVYPDLPQRIPVHWNFQGEPDRWTEKNFVAAFFPGLLSLALQVILWMLIRDLGAAVVETKGADAASGYRRMTLSANVQMFQPLRILLAAMMAMLTSHLPLSAEQNAPGWFGPVMAAIVCLILAIVLGGAWRVWRLQRKWEAEASPAIPEFRAENWRWHGLFYYSPEDATFIVHREIGVGFTINFAHPRVKVYALALAALLLIALAGVFAA
ncbi:MAG: DUF1648 domain-containing protein [Acidobacteria bacterium]|nr:DUF1648 domain-containing protein [Acidobacteriota bacterium]